MKTLLLYLVMAFGAVNLADRSREIQIVWERDGYTCIAIFEVFPDQRIGIAAVVSTPGKAQFVLRVGEPLLTVRAGAKRERDSAKPKGI